MNLIAKNDITKDILSQTDIIIVGSGFFGSTIAERIANECGKRVLILEKRTHIGGNCFSTHDQETGIEYHKYGPHIFHTSNESTWKYITQFTEFNTYRHRVYTQYKNKTYSMPINLGTINAFYEENFSPKDAEAFLRKEIDSYAIESPKNFEEKGITLIGKPLYEAFIRGYTLKQWQTDPTNLPASIINRLPVRLNFNNDYFDDKYQGIPVNGYTAIFEKMLSHELISICLDVDFFDYKDHIPNSTPIVYTGPLDRYFDYKHGTLGWRTVDFERRVEHLNDYFGNAVMNFADESNPYTRAHEFKHYHPERDYTQDKTLLFYETSRFASENDDPYYPINSADDAEKLKHYQNDAKAVKNTYFGGRLGNYKYWDMHHTIASALHMYETLKPKFI
jgi:UDP-galactopyranose mutase